MAMPKVSLPKMAFPKKKWVPCNFLVGNAEFLTL
jgi:hypothetical protein